MTGRSTIEVLSILDQEWSLSILDQQSDKWMTWRHRLNNFKDIYSMLGVHNEC